MSNIEKYCTSCSKNLNIIEFTIEGEIFKTCTICKEQKKEKRTLKNRCEECGIRAIFNFKNQKNSGGIRCKQHMILGMIDIKSPKCIICKVKQPSFNFEGETKATHCKECSEPTMIDIKSPRCIICKVKGPSFNFEGETKATHCKECSEPTMIDIKSPKCDKKDCKTSACFGYINQIKTRCSRHKLLLMFTKTKVCCQEKNCKEISEYGINEPTHCFEHRKDYELCLIGKKCIQCLRNNECYCLSYCRPCQIDQNLKYIIKKKETITLSYLDKHIKHGTIPIDDRIIDGSCVKRRPDRLYDCGIYYLVVEVDENQHISKSYYKGCIFDTKTQEIRRMIQIHEALNMGTVPCVFIRFNPDNFKVKGKKQKFNMQKRLDVLVKWVNYCLNLKETEFVDGNQIIIKYLFYDDYDETNIKFDTINEEIKNMVIV